MGGPFRLKARMRRFARHHPRINFLVRSFVLFSAAFGGAYGFVRGSRPDVSGYDPNTFAIGASFLFALACAGLAMLSMRLRWMRKRMRMIALHNEALADRNWELKEAEERARSLFEAQGDLIVLRNADGVVTFANDAYCALAQADRASIIGTSHGLTVLEQGAVTVDAGGTRIHDQKIASRTGPRWIAWREGLVRTDANQRAETQSVGRDVTERTDVERALGEARDHADAASRAKSRFLAMASHEIRTPLNGIIGMNGLLLETPLTPEQTTYASAVKTSAEALLALIEELLDFSKMEVGRIDLDCRPFVLTALIEEITELLAPRAQARNIEIAAYIDERLPAQVMGDAARLRQVLLNLAGNAIKFTPAGGVTLLVEPGESDGEISFMVRDTGIGIAADAQARIFRDFEQADDRIARSYGGTGLGLSISERIVRRMGGHITLQSAIGQGSTFAFSVSLPEAVDEHGTRKRFEAPDLFGKSILVVAPQSIEASLVARRLGRWGAQTCTTSDIVAARALLPERPWYAVLIGGAFDQADVFAFGEAARQHAAHRIVMVTPAMRHACQNLAAHFTGYLIKPLRSASLAARLTAQATHASPPLASEQSASNDPPDAPTPASAPQPRGLSVLVAEDNEINALLMRALLVRLGHQVVVATDGAAALESWLAAETAGTPYDLVLMDVQMPQLDGIETTRRIRAHEAGQRVRRTPILALTANTLVEDRHACFEAGMDGFLVKPLDRDKLSEALAELGGTTPHLVG